MFDPFDDRPLNRILGIRSNHYASVMIIDVCTYHPLRYHLLRNNVTSVEELLSLSPKQLFACGCGKKAFDQLELLLNKLQSNMETKDNQSSSIVGSTANTSFGAETEVGLLTSAPAIEDSENRSVVHSDPAKDVFPNDNAEDDTSSVMAQENTPLIGDDKELHHVSSEGEGVVAEDEKRDVAKRYQPSREVRLTSYTAQNGSVKPVDIHKIVVNYKTDSRPLYVVFGIDAEDYSDVLIADTCHEVRIVNALHLKNIISFGELLTFSPLEINSFRGIGYLSIWQIDMYIRDVLSNKRILERIKRSKETGLMHTASLYDGIRGAKELPLEQLPDSSVKSAAIEMITETQDNYTQRKEGGLDDNNSTTRDDDKAEPKAASEVVIDYEKDILPFHVIFGVDANDFPETITADTCSDKRLLNALRKNQIFSFRTLLDLSPREVSSLRGIGRMSIWFLDRLIRDTVSKHSSNKHYVPSISGAADDSSVLSDSTLFFSDDDTHDSNEEDHAEGSTAEELQNDQEINTSVSESDSTDVTTVGTIGEETRQAIKKQIVEALEVIDSELVVHALIRNQPVLDMLTALSNNVVNNICRSEDADNADNNEDTVVEKKEAPKPKDREDNTIDGTIKNSKTVPLSHPVLNQLKEAIDLTDPALIAESICGNPCVIRIIEALSAFQDRVNNKQHAQALLDGIPHERHEMSVRWLQTCYTDQELKLVHLRAITDGDEQSLASFIFENAGALDSDLSLQSFIKWCSFDVLSEFRKYLSSLKERELIVLQGRAERKTLAEIGAQFDVSRERVRQIEQKTQRRFNMLQRKNRWLSKLFVETNEMKAITAIDLCSFIGEGGECIVYLLKDCNADEFFYDPQLDAFIFEDRSMPEKIQAYVDTMPEWFLESELQQYVQTGVEEYLYPQNVLEAAIKDSYKKTNDRYHRSRLTLAAIYALLLKKYFPDGIHISDSKAIERFRSLVNEEFHIDVSDRTDHAITSVIARIGMLRDRGKYVFRDNAPLISASLATRIHDYINESDTQIFLTNTIFSLFEDELLKEGIDNKYYLQAILRELYDSEWYFRRDYITKDRSLTSLYSSIVSFIRNAHGPVSKKEIASAFPGVPEIVINISTDDPNVLNLFGEYVHTSCLSLTQHDIVYLQRVIEKCLSNSDVCNSHDVYNMVQADNPELLTRNYILYPFGCYSLLYNLFSDEYAFSRPFIARENATIERPADMIKEMVRESTILEISDVQDFARDNRFYIYNLLEFLNSFNETHLLISKTELATMEYAGVDENVARSVEALILEEITETVPILQLHCLAHLPKIAVPWNCWLIYSILNKWSSALEVSLSYPQFKYAAPLVSLNGRVDTSIQFIDNDTRNGEIVAADDLDNIDDLIADYVTDDLEGI